ncbi:conidiation protein Con-6 [Aspergillus sp. HF37]|nr:conidiation protein Con-6 [Aspergillus sp. HF37]
MSEENVIRGYKAAISNKNVSDQAKAHAQQELSKREEGSTASADEQHERNVVRGLRAATHNPNVTDMGKKQARERLQGMQQETETPGD